MDKELFLLLIALMISALGQFNLFSTVTVVEVTYGLIRLLLFAYRATYRKKQIKSPSSSAKRNGRLRKRN